MLLFLYISAFFQRSIEVFLKIFLISSVIILMIFLQSFITKIDLLPKKIASRIFIQFDRNLMVNYRFLPLLVPMGITLLVFRLKLKYKYTIITGLVLMLITWLVSLTRRHLIGAIVYFAIAYILYNYFNRGSLEKIIFLSIRTLLIILILIAGIRIITPVYYNAGKIAISEAIYVLESGETSTGKTEERLQLSKPFLVSIFRENPYLGTGFDNRWRTGEGNKEGFEASDYPFLSALAMTGIFGILVFLPIYLILIMMLFRDIRFLSKFKNEINPLHYLLLLTFIIYFIFDLMKYMDYFLPVSNSEQYTWFCFLAFYAGLRNKIIFNLRKHRMNGI